MQGLSGAPGALDTSGLDLTPAEIETLLGVNEDDWRAEIDMIEARYRNLGERLPSQMRHQLDLLEERLGL